MRKIIAVSSVLVGYFATASSALAQTIKIDAPTVNGNKVGYTDIADFINKVVTLAFIIAALAVLVMLVWGAIEWIFSGGNKDGVDNARKRIAKTLSRFFTLL